MSGSTFYFGIPFAGHGHGKPSTFGGGNYRRCRNK